MLRVAYLHGVSSKAIIALNNLPSDYIVPGQVLKLPDSAKMVAPLPVTSTKEDQLTKNTNPQNYIFNDSGETLDIDVKAELRNFIKGFENVIPSASVKPKSPTKKKEDSSLGFSMFNRLYGKFGSSHDKDVVVVETVNYMTGSHSHSKESTPDMNALSH